MHIFISLFFIFHFSFIFSQYEITSSYNYTHIGKNIDIGIKKNMKKHSLSFAIKYNINSLVSDNQNEVFKKRFYALNFVEHFGFGFNYQYNFNIRQSFIKPFLFYNSQFSNSHTRNHGFLPYDIDTLTNTILYNEYLVYFGPTIAFENYFGIGYTSKINHRLCVYNKIGFGIIPYFNVDKKIIGEKYHWEFGYFINAGISYLINKKKSP